MSQLDNLLFWILSKRGYHPASLVVHSPSDDVAHHKATGAQLSRYIAHIDAMAQGLGVDVPQRKEPITYAADGK